MRILLVLILFIVTGIFTSTFCQSERNDRLKPSTDPDIIAQNLQTRTQLADKKQAKTLASRQSIQDKRAAFKESLNGKYTSNKLDGRDFQENGSKNAKRKNKGKKPMTEKQKEKVKSMIANRKSNKKNNQ